MKSYYIASKYRSKSIAEIKQNCDLAWNVAKKYWGIDKTAFCPVMNSYLMDSVSGEELWTGKDAEIFMEGDMYWLEKSDAIVMCKGWEKSEGARAELEYAKKLGKEIIFD